MHQMLLIAYSSQLLLDLTHKQEHLLKAYKCHLLCPPFTASDEYGY